MSSELTLNGIRVVSHLFIKLQEGSLKNPNETAEVHAARVEILLGEGWDVFHGLPVGAIESLQTFYLEFLLSMPMEVCDKA